VIINDGGVKVFYTLTVRTVFREIINERSCCCCVCM